MTPHVVESLGTNCYFKFEKYKSDYLDVCCGSNEKYDLEPLILKKEIMCYILALIDSHMISESEANEIEEYITCYGDSILESKGFK